MTDAALPPKANGAPLLRFDRATAFVVGVCLLCPLTNLKLGDIQSVEVFGLFYVLYAYGVFALRRGTFQAHREVIKLTRSYIFFLIVVFALALAALRLQTFPPFLLGILKTPPVLSLSRIFQLAICMIGSMLLIVSITRKPELLSIASRYFVIGGLISAIYGLVSAISWAIGFELPGAYAIESIRVRGFFVEGGPFGIYMLSVWTIILFRHYQLRAISRVSMWLQSSLVIVAFFAAQSKAATLLLILIGITYLFLTKKYLKLFFGSIVAAPLLAYFVTQGGLAGYVENYVNFAEAAKARPDDGSLVLGRLMASILAPRIIAEHPIAGIGIGNYSLQRNNPDLLDGLPQTDAWDLPGFGFIGYAAELGIPATIFLMWLLWRPVTIALRLGAGARVAALGSLQFYVHVMGAQITFIYPWLVSSIVIGYSLTFNNLKKVRE